MATQTQTIRRSVKKQSEIIAVGCSGGVAAGVNSVLFTLILFALANGKRILALEDAFMHLINFNPKGFKLYDELKEAYGLDASGGSRFGNSKPGIPKIPANLKDVLGRVTRRTGGMTNKKNIDDLQDLGKILCSLQSLKVTKLIWIGGDDSARLLGDLVAAANALAFPLKVILIPKTMDNDVMLPHPRALTIGFQTAAVYGAEAVEGLLGNAEMLQVPIVYEALGRTAGHVALRIMEPNPGAMAVVGEEFSNSESMEECSLLLASGILKYRSIYGNWGLVIVVGENITECLDPETIPGLSSLKRDAMGNLPLGKVKFAEFAAKEVAQTLARFGICLEPRAERMSIAGRSQKPIKNERRLCHALAQHALTQIIAGVSEVAVYRAEGQDAVVPFASIVGKTRRVGYQALHQARTDQWMRMTAEDLASDAFVDSILQLTPKIKDRAEFREIFGPIAKKYGRKLI